MTDRATLEALLARVLEGEGPDRELDAEIGAALRVLPTNAVGTNVLGWLRRWEGPFVTDPALPGHILTQTRINWKAPPYTASLDAALTLVPEEWRVNTADWSIPGVYSWTLRGPCRKYVTNADGWDEAGDDWFRTARASTPAHALIAACLKARMEVLGE